METSVPVPPVDASPGPLPPSSSAVLSALDAVGSRMQEATESVVALGEVSSQVETLVATLERLARQTRRVALNASIEAARAGETGREFAIVADAMRRLAEESAGSARAAASSVARTRDAVDDVARLVAGAARATAVARAELGAGGIGGSEDAGG